jgi:LuxR family transcriptional regulator/LuxR family quorum-sensing system transcriptional regulator CciR
MYSQAASAYDRAPTIDAVWAIVEAYARESGYSRAFYLHLPRPGAQEAPFHRGGRDPVLVAQYIEEKLYLVDPCVMHALQSAAPFALRAVARSRSLSPAEEAYRGALEAQDLADGVGVPAFGPALRAGYFELGHPARAPAPAGEAQREAHWVCQLAHLRICALLAEASAAATPLTAREREILEWVAQGKSNETIAIILGISPHTVDTYLRRIYEKLGVCDRISATLRGLARGEIRGAL